VVEDLDPSDVRQAQRREFRQMFGLVVVFTLLAAGGWWVWGKVTQADDNSQSAAWDLGEGHGKHPVTCRGPGKPYLFAVPDDQQQTGCSYVFQWASDDHRHDTHGEDHDDVYHARASIVWAVTWTATSGETGALADMTTTAAFDLTIGEIQAVVCYDAPLGQCNPATTLG
jgi:hypothetical protein